MDERAADKIIAATHWPRAMAASALGVLALFLLVGTMGELKSFRYIGSGIAPTNTITVSGEGVVFAVPDVAQFSVSVQETAKDVKTAQGAATAKGNAIIDYLKGAGVADKDVQTTDYSVSPQYKWSQTACPQGSSYCPGGEQVLTGYQVSQTLSVKVRDTAKAGDILAGVGGKGASQVSGLDFTIDDQNAVEAQARDKAITDAKAKAQVLAKSLGVSLVRIVSFNESGGPVYYAAKSSGAMAMDSAVAPSPQIPTGQNKITSDITLTYEIQ